MRSTIKIFGLALMALISLRAAGDGEGAFSGGEVLWWMVQNFNDSDGNLSGTTIYDFDGTAIPHNEGGSYTVRGMDVNAARVRVVDTDSYLDIYVNVGGVARSLGSVVDVPGYYFAAVGPYNSEAYSFMIELGNYDYDTGAWYALAVSDAASYTTLKNVDHQIAEWSVGPSPTQTGGYWIPNAYTVPEPTSGLLMLLGGALLALRRRRNGGN